MDKNFNKIAERAKTFSLTKEEKKLLLSRVSDHIKQNPIPEAESPFAPYIRYAYRSVAPLSILWRNKITILILSIFSIKRDIE